MPEAFCAAVGTGWMRSGVQPKRSFMVMMARTSSRVSALAAMTGQDRIWMP
jgi:hypothetical protein